MRGAFIHTYDAYYGPLSTQGAPNTQYVFAQPCRKVSQLKIFQDQFPFTLSTAWMTHDAPSLNGPDVTAPWVPATFSDYLTADQVVISSDPLKRYVYCRSEFVNPVVRPSYWRGLLIDVASLVDPPWLPPVPPPPPPPPPSLCVVPGFDCASAPTAAPGVVCPYTVSAGTDQWFQVAPTGPPPYPMSMNVTSGVVDWEIWEGISCGGLTLLMSGSGPFAMPVFATPGFLVWVVFKTTVTPSSYDWTFIA